MYGERGYNRGGGRAHPRNRKQRDEFRESGAPKLQNQQDIHYLKNKTLFFGFQESYIPRVGHLECIQKRAVTLPISTRQTGFITQAVFSKVYAIFTNIPEFTPWAFYRITLGQLELKLLGNLCSKVLSDSAGQEDLFYRPRLSIDFRDIIRAAPVSIAPIPNIIHAIGSFEHAGKVFYVKPLKHPTLGILLSNLRQTVVAMENANTPLDIRRMFYEHNPLPYAEWTTPIDVDERRRERIPAGAAAGHPDHPLLLNADQIMPPDYDNSDLERDIHKYRNFVEFLGRKNSLLLSGPCAIDYNSGGHKRQLVSNYMTGLRNPTCTNFGGGIQPEDYAAAAPPSGDLDTFWSSEILESNEMFVGALNLLGEIPHSELMNRAEATRCQFTAVQTASRRYATLLGNYIID